VWQCFSLLLFPTTISETTLQAGIPADQPSCCLSPDRTEVTSKCSPKAASCSASWTDMTKACFLLISLHVLRQERHANQNLSPLPGVSLGPSAEGISRSKCQPGAFCWPVRCAGRWRLKSTYPSHESRADLSAISEASNLTVPFSAMFRRHK